MILRHSLFNTENQQLISFCLQEADKTNTQVLNQFSAWLIIYNTENVEHDEVQVV
jgi:hypothetical protein